MADGSTDGSTLVRNVAHVQASDVVESKLDDSVQNPSFGAIGLLCDMRSFGKRNFERLWGLPKHMADMTDSDPVWTRREQIDPDGLKYEVRTIGTAWRHKRFHQPRTVGGHTYCRMLPEFVHPPWDRFFPASSS